MGGLGPPDCLKGPLGPAGALAAQAPAGPFEMNHAHAASLVIYHSAPPNPPMAPGALDQPFDDGGQALHLAHGRPSLRDLGLGGIRGPGPACEHRTVPLSS